MIHKIKLRKQSKHETIICPYNESGICCRNGCIYLPHMDCVKKGGYTCFTKSYKEYIQEKKKSRKGGKKQ